MGRGYGYGDMMGGYGWFGTLLLFFFGVLVIAGIVLLVIWAVRASTHHPGTGSGAAPPPGAAGHDEAVAIAKRRLASGEITKDQYDEIMRALGG
jgi:uncharacterized membrane protein